MCICPVGLNGSSCGSIVVENKVNAKCVSLNITLLLMYVRHKFVWIPIALLVRFISVNNICVIVLLLYLKCS